MHSIKVKAAKAVQEMPRLELHQATSLKNFGSFWAKLVLTKSRLASLSKTFLQP
jgi:hypothetical protein